MPKVETSVAHALGRETATERLKSLVTRLRERYGDRVSDVDEWWGSGRSAGSGTFSLRLMGALVKGTAEIGDDDVNVRVELPFAASMFKSQIRSAIQDELRACLRADGP